MKIDKAIEILQSYVEWCDPIKEIDVLDALKLGIEALERCKYLSEHTSRWAGVLLPGETE